MKDHRCAFLKRVSTKELRVAVVGLGYVGLPLAIEFARKGFPVTGIDVDRDRIERLNKKVSYITDVPTSHIRSVYAQGRFRAESSFRPLAEADAIIICVPTPLKRKYTPDISFILGAVRQVRSFLRPGQLVVLESTTYPGTTEETILPILESTGLACGKDFFLAFSPERIDPGNQRFPLHRIPKVIGGITPEATDMTRALYGKIVARTVPVSSARVAETVKLLENTFRIVNIGLIDEIAMMAHAMGMNVWEIVGAAATKPFGFMPFYPGPGVGGHCIPKDPLYLFWKAKKHGFRCRFIKLASDIITAMPHYVVTRLERELRREGKKLPGARILVLGATYKKDIKDLRKSPALDIMELLIDRGSEVSYHDPLIPYLKFDKLRLHSASLSDALLRRADFIVIATDHSSVDYAFIRRHARRIFDARNVYAGVSDPKITVL